MLDASGQLIEPAQIDNVEPSGDVGREYFIPGIRLVLLINDKSPETIKLSNCTGYLSAPWQHRTLGVIATISTSELVSICLSSDVF